MRRAFLLVLLVVVASISFAQFRGYEWGTPLGDILDELGPADNVGLQYYAFMPDDNDKWARVFYGLEDGRLASGRLLYAEEYWGEAAAIRKFNEISEVLTSLYGDPIQSVMNWASDSSRRLYSDNLPFALIKDFIQPQHAWGTDEMLIQMTLYSDGPMIMIEYISMELSDEWNDWQEKKQRSKF